ncbi:MAG: hypothetical protein H0U48_09500 [Euzebyaceae bacterium]|nr:hypothetical protein [Euzebyaceae bacterium]
MTLPAPAAASRRRPDGAAGPGPSGGAGRRPPSLGPTPAGPRGRQSLPLLAAAFATLYCEFEAGRRPRRHLTSMATPLLVARLAAASVRPSTPATVARVLVVPVESDTAEAVVVVRRGERYTALALRLVRTGDGWRIDDVARPELGGLPPPPFPMPADEEDGFAAVAAGLPQLACDG